MTPHDIPSNFKGLLDASVSINPDGKTYDKFEEYKPSNQDYSNEVDQYLGAEY